MRFLVDECTGPAVAAWLKEQNHVVFSVYDQMPGISDYDVIRKAFDENWLLITNDKDFGEMVFRERHPHRGVIFLRLTDERASNKIMMLGRFLEEYAEKLTEQFVVVTETHVRFSHR